MIITFILCFFFNTKFTQRFRQGECIYVQTENGQRLIITDYAWFIEILNELLVNKTDDSSKFEYNQYSNFTHLKLKWLKSSEFLTRFKISNLEQLDHLVSILNHFNFLIKYQTDKENSLVIPHYFSKSNSNSSINLVFRIIYYNTLNLSYTCNLL